MKRSLCLLSAAVLLLSLAGCAPKTPAAPAEVRAAVTGELCVELSWEDSADAEFYRVYRIEGTKTDYRFLCDVQTPSYTDSTVQSGGIYGYKITAMDGRAESEGCLSDKLEITAAEETALKTPTVPAITSVTRIDAYTAVIMFDTDNTGCTYKIMRSETYDGTYTLIGETADAVYYDTSLTDGKSYYYTVTAVNSAVSGAASQPQKIGMNAKEVFGVPVLMYHQFLTPEEVEKGSTFGEYAIWKSDFEADLIWLRDNGYTTVTTAELMQYMNGEATPPKKPVILTIDDGWRGVYLNAWPLLQEYHMKAVLAVIGALIDEATAESSSDEERLYCSWEELAEMEASGALEIISHTATCHDDEEMTHIRRGANCAEGETEESFLLAAIPDYANMAKRFKEYLGFEPYAMSYPYSSRSEVADRVWMQCGYRILYAGNSEDARKSSINYFAAGAGITRDSAVLRRVARMNGTSLENYMRYSFY